MNKKLLIGSLVSLMIILSVMLSVNVVAAPNISSSSLLTKGLGTAATAWANVSGGNIHKINITILGGNLVSDNATNVTIKVPSYISVLLSSNQTDYVGASNGTPIGFKFSGISSNTGNGSAGSIISFVNFTGGWNTTGSYAVRYFLLNFTADDRSADYNVTWNVTLWNTTNGAVQTLLNMGVNSNATMVISSINATDDGTNILYAYGADSTVALTNFNGSGKLQNSQNNITIYATITNAGTRFHNITLYAIVSGVNSTNTTSPLGMGAQNQKRVMTYLGNNIYRAIITNDNWTLGESGLIGPTDIVGASFINMSFLIFANDTLNLGFDDEANNSNVYYNITLDGTYPVTPEIEMPKTTIIYAGNKIIIKCLQKGDFSSGVKTTEVKITKPDGTTVTKEVNSASEEAEFLGSDYLNTAGEYQVSCTTTDYVGWTKDDTTTDEFRVIYYTTGAGGGEAGEAGTGGTTETKIFDVDFSKLDEKIFTRNEGTTITFSLDGSIEHKITWTKVEANSVTLTIESTPQEVKLNIGESKDVDVTGDSVNDINVKLVNIDGTKAELLTTKLVGAAETPTPSEQETPGGETGEEGITGEAGTSSTTWIIIAIVVIVIIIIGYFFMRKK